MFEILLFALIGVCFIAIAYILGTMHGYDEALEDYDEIYETFGDRVIIVKEKS